MSGGLMTVNTRHNAEEIGCLSIEVFSDTIHFLLVQSIESEVTLSLNDRVEGVTKTSYLQQALVYLEQDNQFSIKYS